MSTTSQDVGPASREPDEGQRPSSGFMPFLSDKVRKLSPFSAQLFSGAWPPSPSHLPHYFLAMIAGFAGWQAHTPVTVIAPFQMPKSELPFSAEIVADALQDALTSIHDEITRENSDPRLKPAEMDLPVLRDLNSPKFSTAQDATRFTVEVKGVSYERIVSAARALWRSEKIISGDVVLNGNDKDFILVARMPGGGPWQSVLSPATADG